MAHQLGASSTLCPHTKSAALLTSILNLNPKQQSDGNLVAGLAAGQYGCLLDRSCASGLAESVRNEQEVRTLLHRGKDNMPEMRKRLRMDVEPDRGQRALSVVVSTPPTAGGPANAPLPASFLATGGCAGALMPLTINPAPTLITSGEVQPVQPPCQVNDGGFTAIDKLQYKRNGRRATILKNANEPKKLLNEPVVQTQMN